MADSNETDVGISAFMSDIPRFKCELKKFYEDFHVHEISCDGNTIRLSELVTKSVVAAEVSAVKKQANIPQPDLLDGDEQSITLDKLEALLGAEQVEKIIQMLASTEHFCLLGSVSDKAKRTEIHKTITTEYPFLYSDTVESSSGERPLRIWKKKSYQDAQRQERTDFHNAPDAKKPRTDEDRVKVRWAEPWPKERPEFLHFHLYKENKDTNEAISNIAKCMRKQPKQFSVAGIKDKRGITTQAVSLWRVTAEQLRRVVLHPDFDGRAIKISDMSYKPNRLQIGDLSGNRFDVVLRSVSSVSAAASALEALRVNGFLNYFGLQRFGTRATRTHTVGAALISKDWELAARKILGEDDSHAPEGLQMYLKGESATAALKRMHEEPRRVQTLFRNEMDILKCLSEQPNNYSGAVNSLSQKSLTFYLHAFQSYLFNTALSHRAKLSRKVLPGDLVLVDGSPLLVSEEDQAKYAFTDIVLPLPGSSIELYPASVPRDFYEELCMQQFGCSLDEVESQLPGTYRKILEIPVDLTWRVIEAPDAGNLRLIQSDFASFLPDNTTPNTPLRDYDGSPAILLTCTLKPSAYLTMAVREIASTASGETEAEATLED